MHTSRTHAEETIDIHRYRVSAYHRVFFPCGEREIQGPPKKDTWSQTTEGGCIPPVFLINTTFNIHTTEY